jgi:hypothetical protein
MGAEWFDARDRGDGTFEEELDRETVRINSKIRIDA